MKTLMLIAALIAAPLVQSADSLAPSILAQAKTMTSGEVRKIDKEQGKVTIRHEALTNLGMPAMTMVFRVKDRAMLDQVKEGQKIQFFADRVDGSLTVVEWRPAN